MWVPCAFPIHPAAGALSTVTVLEQEEQLQILGILCLEDPPEKGPGPQGHPDEKSCHKGKQGPQCPPQLASQASL